MSVAPATILIAGTVDLDPDKREAALEAAAKLFEGTRAQDGCLDYVWSADLAVPGRIYVYERWRDEASLAAHFGGHWYTDMLGTISSFGLKGVDVLKYRIDLAEPVYDPSGRPRADFFSEQA